LKLPFTLADVKESGWFQRSNSRLEGEGIEFFQSFEFFVANGFDFRAKSGSLLYLPSVSSGTILASPLRLDVTGLGSILDRFRISRLNLRTKIAIWTLAVGSLLPTPLAQQSAIAQAPTSIRGFAPERVAAQRELEQKLLRLADPAVAERNLRFLTSEPHLAGTDGSRRVAEYLRDQYQSFGLEAELATYKVWLPHPKEVRLELLTPEKKVLGTQEDPFERDPDSLNKSAVLGYNGFSPSGEVTAPVVYANYGLPADYKRLAELDVNVEGKIVLVRYGGAFRGVKVRVAEENKAAAVIIYSDPADDGYVAGDAYPRGPWRPESAIQRGSIYYGFIYSGDPLTPGIAATESALRLDPAKAETLPRIPAMPINYRDAEQILQTMNGPRVPREWQGGLPLSYHAGPSQSPVHVKLVMDYQLRTIYDPVARLRGQNDNEWVVVGNHHDAWVFGAVDPSSGTTALLEAARALGDRARSGWKPRRTIVLANWDAEEFGLIGSVEWVEEHRAELQRKAVAYINVDSAVSGPNFGASASPSLREFVRDVAREITDPRTGRSVYEAWAENQQKGRGRRVPAGLAQQPDSAPSLGVLGSGSDFTPFFHHAGIPSLDVGFGGEYGVYHSTYDNFYWMKTWGDPSFAYHAAAGRLIALMLARFAEADALPFNYENYASEIQRYVMEVQAVVKSDPDGKVDLKNLFESVEKFAASAERAQKLLRHPKIFEDSKQMARMNRALVETEQAFLSPSGLAGRSWYKHTIYAPGSYSGYAAVTLPGVREAIERRDWDAARREAAALAEAVRRAAASLDRVSSK
jgi:N-acetylated-alpha-linked acidic dipeptidase